MSQSCQRQVSFLCAEKSMHEPGVGFLLRMFRPSNVFLFFVLLIAYSNVNNNVNCNSPC
jgi:hypothetical protein